ncbi:MBL fold metallo-hydrolase [Acinetobacter vivianii]|uniref:MBL fold metallo-hydrolase n=1 Tax=Acinetobacter vivianii TaxID=1776742 RepID=UPI004041796D
MGLIYSIKFHAIGQGLFSSGVIDDKSDDGFNFVYDCGTASKRKLLDDAISSEPFGKARQIDLVAISHFDSDHISGFQRLLKEYSVKILLLPYLSLEQRLFIAFSNKIGVSDAQMSFYLDPVKYLLNRFDKQIDRIVLVPPSSRLNSEDNLSNEVENERVFIDIDEKYNDMSIDSKYSGRVKRLKDGGRIWYKNLFEFIPYNDSSETYKINKDFLRVIEKEKNNILKANNVNDIQAGLARIRDRYDKCFGNSAVKRNIISMFLFLGPCQSNRSSLSSLHIVDFENNSLMKKIGIHDGNCTLFTGDGYLDNKLRLTKLTEFLGSERISRIGCFQVMHHGSRNNWHTGVAKALSPKISIFSSDPNHKKFKHPHADVVKDFFAYGPIQVDKVNFAKVYFFE